jgi:vacuolar-type H+-ATPase subunit I/STV1
MSGRTAPLLLALTALLLGQAPLSADQPDDIKKLLQERLATVREGMKHEMVRMQAGVSDSLDKYLQWSQRVLRTELELAEKKADRIAAWEAQLKRTKQVEELAQNQVKVGLVPNTWVFEAKYQRQSAEIGLTRAKQAK